jgi:hypothetical protein
VCRSCECYGDDAAKRTKNEKHPILPPFGLVCICLQRDRLAKVFHVFLAPTVTAGFIGFPSGRVTLRRAAPTIQEYPRASLTNMPSDDFTLSRRTFYGAAVVIVLVTVLQIAVRHRSMWPERIIRFLRDAQRVIREIGKTVRVCLGTAAGIYGAFELVRKMMK